MIEKYLRGNIQFLTSLNTWEEAIEQAAKPLLENNTINTNYIKAMKDNVIENGNYIILLPKIAMPHARHEYGSLKTGMSFLKLDKPVMFPNKEPVNIFFVLASNTNDGHLDLIAELAELLTNDDITDNLQQITNEEELISLIQTI